MPGGFPFPIASCFFLIHKKGDEGTVSCVCAKSLQSCPTLCDPVDCSPPGSSVHEILRTRILEWVAILFSRGSFQSRSPALQADSLPFKPPGKCISAIGCWILVHRSLIKWRSTF